jgi:hypothetical protein
MRKKKSAKKKTNKKIQQRELFFSQDECKADMGVLTEQLNTAQEDYDAMTQVMDKNKCAPKEMLIQKCAVSLGEMGEEKYACVEGTTEKESPGTGGGK